MTSQWPFAASLVLLLTTAPAFAASCDAELTALDQRVHKEATTAIATASGGEGVAAKRNGEAVEASKTGAPVKVDQKGPAGSATEAQTTEAAAKAGGSGDRVMQAKVAINDARVAKGKGDEAGCLAAAAKAKDLLKN